MKRTFFAMMMIGFMSMALIQSHLISADQTQQEGPLVLMVLSNTDAGKKEDIQKISHYYQQRGFLFKAEPASQYPKPEALKEALIEKYENEDLNYVILPEREFRKPLPITIDGEVFDQPSDKYFSNLYDNEDMSNEISVARSGVDDLSMIAGRAFSDDVYMDIAFPIINFLRQEGRCWIYPEVDPSLLGTFIKSLSLEKGFNVATYFETEGDSPSGQKPDFPLNKESILASTSNFQFFISTVEELRVDPDGHADINQYKDFYRAVFVDENQNGSADYGEVEVKEYFSFSDQKTTFHKIGFLPLFDNSSMNLNQFSSIIGHEMPKGIPLHFGESSGRTASYLAILRLVMENLLSGKTVGESIDVYHQFHERFGYDPFKQSIFAFTLFVRGDPTLRLQDLAPKESIEIVPEDSLTLLFNLFGNLKIKNTGSQPITWEIETQPDWLVIYPKAGLIRPQREENISITAFPGLFGKEKEGKIRILTNMPEKKTIEITVKRNFFSR